MIYAGGVPRAPNAAITEEQMVLTRRAKILLHQLRDTQVALPLVAISELLVPVSVAKHGLLLNHLRDMFICAEFNERAASIAAGLWAKYKGIPADQKYDDRHVMRADAKILASAKAAGASVFYRNDDNCRILANIIMTDKGLPKNFPELFIDQLMAEGLESKPKNAPMRRSRRKP